MHAEHDLLALFAQPGRAHIMLGCIAVNLNQPEIKTINMQSDTKLVVRANVWRMVRLARPLYLFTTPTTRTKGTFGRFGFLAGLPITITRSYGVIFACFHLWDVTVGG
jgi:hypothetical protein